MSLERLYSKITNYLVSTINNSRSLHKVISPIASGYQSLAGYRKLGLKYDDLFITENEAVKEAIKRLPEQELQARMYRQKRAMQAGIMHKEQLSKSEQMTIQEDKLQLRDLVERVEREIEEKANLDSAK